MNTSLIFLFSMLFCINLCAQTKTKTGYLKVTSTNIDSFYVTINGDFKNTKFIATGDSLLLPIGFQDVRISGYNFNDITSTFGIGENQTSHFRIHANKYMHNEQSNSYLINYFKGNILIHSDDDSKIFVNDTLLAKGLARLYTNTKFIKITLTNDAGFSISKNISVDPVKFELIEIFTRPERDKLFLMSAFPGAGQLYKHENAKAITLLGLTSFSTLFILSGEEYDPKFNQTLSYKTGLIFLCSLLIYNFIDGISEPDRGFRTTKSMSDFIDTEFKNREKK